MILVTSAAGRTGGMVARTLHGSGRAVRAFDRNPRLSSVPAVERMSGNLLDKNDLRRACEGVESIIHTGPMSADESTMGVWLIDAAKAAGVGHFVYHSVIHSQTEWLLNHQNKARVEDHLIDSGLPFTILQPMHYFQNIDVPRIAATGVFRSAYSETVALSHVDMADLAEVSAKVVGSEKHHYATYEICGGDHFNTRYLVECLSRHLGKPIGNEKVSVEALLADFGMPSEGYFGDFLHRLMMYYNRNGIRGNPNVLEWLLGRPATTLSQYIERSIGS